MAKSYSPKLKFQVVKELLTTNKSAGQLGRIYGVHPNTINNWLRVFEEQGAEIFDKAGSSSEYERRIADLEQMLGKKEIEIALLKNFLGQRH